MKLRAERVAEYGGDGWYVEVVQAGREKYAKVRTDEYMSRSELAKFRHALEHILKAMVS